MEISDYNSEETENLDCELTKSEIDHLLQAVRDHKDVIDSLLARIELLTVMLRGTVSGSPLAIR